MGRFQYLIYAPPGDGSPWMAVTLDGVRVVDSFACPSKQAAEQVLRSMQVRWTVKNRRVQA